MTSLKLVSEWDTWCNSAWCQPLAVVNGPCTSAHPQNKMKTPRQDFLRHPCFHRIYWCFAAGGKVSLAVEREVLFLGSSFKLWITSLPALSSCYFHPCHNPISVFVVPQWAFQKFTSFDIWRKDVFLINFLEMKLTSYMPGSISCELFLMKNIPFYFQTLKINLNFFSLSINMIM